MPELPEVEFGRRVAETVGAGRIITTVRADRDPIVFEGVSPRRVQRHLTGRRVLAVRRRGKQLWMELDERPWPLFHFGMTGSFQTPNSHVLTLASSPSAPDPDWPPRFAKIHLTFDDGGELVMVNKRRLGRILFRNDPEHEPPISRLGFDPLLDMPTLRRFTDLLRGRKGNIKGLLLDQRFAAGVGNWIADEVLYQAGIDPHRTADSLAPPEVRKLRNKLSRIIKRAVSVDADKTRFPRTWLFHRRWGKQQEATTARGESIAFADIAGRTTAWVPERQQ